MKLAKILVSGGNGFLGSHLCKHFEKKGIGIISEKNTTNTIREIDVTDLSRLLAIRDQVKAVVHLAAKTSITNSLRSPHDTYYTNVVGTLNLLEFARQKKVNNFINVSTYVYGQPRYLPIDEKHPVDPQSPYNASKVAAEQLCQSYSNSFEMNIVTLRPFYLYGPSSRPNSFIGCILEQMKRNEGKVVLSGAQTRRDFLYVDDFVNLIEIILQNFPTGYGIYNVGSGQSYSLTEVSLILAKLLGKTISINYDNKMRPGDITDMVADISRISSAFGWKPETSLEEGLIRALQLNYK